MEVVSMQKHASDLFGNMPKAIVADLDLGVRREKITDHYEA
jgi:hypothetical protein